MAITTNSSTSVNAAITYAAISQYTTVRSLEAR